MIHFFSLLILIFSSLKMHKHCWHCRRRWWLCMIVVLCFTMSESRLFSATFFLLIIENKELVWHFFFFFDKAGSITALQTISSETIAIHFDFKYRSNLCRVSINFTHWLLWIKIREPIHHTILFVQSTSNKVWHSTHKWLWVIFSRIEQKLCHHFMDPHQEHSHRIWVNETDAYTKFLNSNQYTSYNDSKFKSCCLRKIHFLKAIEISSSMAMFHHLIQYLK